jgi:hypothetical protein
MLSAPFHRRSRAVVIAVELAVGVGAIYGGVSLLHDAEGFGLKESWLDGSPFPDYTIPAIFLLVVIGGGMLVSALLAWRSSSLAPLAALKMGFILVAWLIIETAIIGFHGPQQPIFLALCGSSALTLIAAATHTLTTSP